eukprot:GFKZ01005898.1.p1 GENE.GFKZ01005898.1~~GFKZ01005898.1.p1  ORF type:complete len:316 (+),score=26.35 GFKZ01005898.1:124-1071(+)
MDSERSSRTIPSSIVTFVTGSPVFRRFKCAHEASRWKRQRPLLGRNPNLRPALQVVLSQKISPPDNGDSEFAKLEADIRDYLQTCPDFGQNPLTYMNLGKAGRVDLASRILENGGYIYVSKRLGIPVDETDFVPPPVITAPNSLELQTQDPGASLVIGRDLEARLASVEQVLKNTTEANGRLSSDRISRSRPNDDVPTAEELRLTNEKLNPPVQDIPVPEGERLTLSGQMRVGTLIWTTAIALGFGRTSPAVLPETIIQLCQSLAEALTVAHLVVAGYGAAVLASQMKRNRALWFFKLLLSGPIGLRDLRALGPL